MSKNIFEIAHLLSNRTLSDAYLLCGDTEVEMTRGGFESPQRV